MGRVTNAARDDGDAGLFSDQSLARAFSLVSLAVAVIVGIAHIAENYAYTRHLLRIPDQGLAQVAAMQTENAFYYSYYAELVEADSVVGGLERIVWDQRSEYPDVLNALRRFNIYQEVVLALEYRALRFAGLNFVDPWSFFRHHILVLNGVGHAALSLLASELSGNPLAGASCFVISFLNRFQISRLGNYSSSDLREIWGIPILWVQVLCLWHLLVAPPGSANSWLWRSFGFITFIFIVVWQFSPFLLLLQATALYFVYLVCGYRELRPVVVGAIDVYMVALAAAVLVHFGSPYLLTSPFLFQLIGLKVATSVCFCSRRRGNANVGVSGRFRACCAWALGRAADVGEGLVALVGFVLVRKLVAPFATADTHVYEILCTKVAAVNELLPARLQMPESRLPECAEPSFNARLYLIMGVFNLLERASLDIYYASTASPAAALACCLIVLRCFVGTFGASSNPSTGPGQRKQAKSEDTGRKAAAPAAKSASKSKEDAAGLRHRKPGAKAQEGAADVAGPSEAQHDDVKATSTVQPAESLFNPEQREDAAMLFFVVQFILFLALGALVNRLRVAFGPPMMVLAVCCFGPRLFPSRWLLRRHRPVVLSVLAGLFGFHFLQIARQLPCVSSSDGICHHLADKSSSDGDLADLCDWINHALEPSTPVLSSMNLAGSLRLFTAVPLVIHPQFESENLRKRVQLGYELYHCGSEESFEDTMKKLHAEVVVFEYARCFFTPYLLDDRRKNCNAKKHQTEDQLCVKLHAQSRRFELLFGNGGYAVFRLRKTPLPAPADGSELTPAVIKKRLVEPETWMDYVKECRRSQGELCGARLLEMAAAFEHGLKRKQVASVLRRLAERQFPEDGYVLYYLARHFDYDAGNTDMASVYYKKALQKLPNNPIVLKEYIMFLDVGVKDAGAIGNLMRERQKDRGDGRIPLLSLEGAGVGLLLCEAAVSAKNTPGLASFGDQMWAKALRLAPLSQCVQNNWPMIYGETSTYNDAHQVWDKVWYLWTGGVQHEVGSHHQPALRFLGDRPFTLSPLGNRSR